MSRRAINNRETHKENRPTDLRASPHLQAGCERKRRSRSQLYLLRRAAHNAQLGHARSQLTRGSSRMQMSQSLSLSLCSSSSSSSRLRSSRRRNETTPLISLSVASHLISSPPSPSPPPSPNGSAESRRLVARRHWLGARLRMQVDQSAHFRPLKHTNGGR